MVTTARCLLPVLLVASLVGCAADETTGSGDPGNCGPGEYVTPSGACIYAGVPADQCGLGFASDGRNGCEPVLPAEPCAPGTIALPGETSCHELAPCGDGTWGAIPVDSTTQFVDMAYAGGSSDGSVDRPWTRIQDGVDAADTGVVVAVAAGTYHEDVEIEGKGVRLWGRCPQMVEVVGATATSVAVWARSGAHGAEVHRLAATGLGTGLGVTRSTDVLVDAVWVHDVEGRGIGVEAPIDPTSVTLQGSLVEATRGIGIYVGAADLNIQGTVIRDAGSLGSGTTSRGIAAEAILDYAGPARLTVHSSVVERSREGGVFAVGAEVTVDDTLIRDTRPNGDDSGGIGLGAIISETTGTPAQLTVAGSVIDGGREIGVWVSGSTLAMERTVVRNVASNADGWYGRGMSVQQDFPTGTLASLTLERSVVERCQEALLFVGGSPATLDRCLLRDATADGLGRYGLGLVTMYGLGLAPAEIVATSLRIERVLAFGVQAHGSQLVLERSQVSNIHADEQGLFGDGLSVVNEAESHGEAQVTDSRIQQAARVGISNFGASVGLLDVQLDCNPVHLNGESAYTSLSAQVVRDFSFADDGGNVCGCGAETEDCVVRSTGLSAPDPLEPKESL